MAAQRPEMRFVEPKSEEQQARAVLLRARQRLLHQRTELVNALGSVLYEHGFTFPSGIGNIKWIEETLNDLSTLLPPLDREECINLVKKLLTKRCGSTSKRKSQKIFPLSLTTRDQK